MQGKLIIHIGPPKTATTSLQHYWLKLNTSGFKYLGIIQPRDQKSVGSKLYNFVSSKTRDKFLENELVETIESSMLRYKYVVISEEMFVLEQSSISYFEKLKNLFELINRFQPVITYCVRNAEQVYFSYYLQIYNSLPRNLQNSFENFQESNFSDCYKYEKMHTLLTSIGFNKINLFFFKDLVSGSCTMNDILGIKDLDYSFRIELEKKNITNIENKELKVSRITVLEAMIKKLSNTLPFFLRGTGIGIFFVKKSKMKTFKKLNRSKINQKSRDNYLNDILFIESLKMKNEKE